MANLASYHPALPVSEKNEFSVIKQISHSCEKAIEDLNQCPQGGPEVCQKLRASETKAITRTLEFLRREKEALDLKEYYQERRLKDLGLDSEWSQEDDIGADPDLGSTGNHPWRLRLDRHLIHHGPIAD